MKCRNVAQSVERQLIFLERSSHREKLDVISVSDFKPMIDLWLLHPRYLGNLQ